MVAAAAATAAANTALDAARPTTKEYEEMHEELLRVLAGIPKDSDGNVPNRVAGYYNIRTDQPLPELDTALARAFAAQDERDPNRSLYALVCSHKMPVRGHIIKALTGASIPNYVTLHAHGMAQLSGTPGRRVVLIYDRPKGKSLNSILAEKGSLSEQFIAEHVVAPLAGIIQHFAELHISHGRINPDNIFFSEVLTLGECAAEPCGYSQPYRFEPPERAQAVPSGKGESTAVNDVFSLGVLAAYLRLGPRLFEKAPTQEQHITRLLRDGCYVAFTGNIEFSEQMVDLLRGTLLDNPKERWTWQQLKPWAKGRRYNMLAPSLAAIATRPFQVDNDEYYNLRGVSHALYNSWDLAARVLQAGTLIRWLDMSARRKEIADILRRAHLSLGGASTARTTHQNNELTARILTILDPQAPLSMKEVRAHPTGIGPVMAEGYRTAAPHYVQHCIEMIDQGTPTVWADMYRRREEEPPGDVTNALWLLDRMRVILRIPGLGFGVERMLYDLNPDLPCQSPLLEGYAASNLKDLLLSLNQVAYEKARDEPPFDRHIAGFIAAKLSLGRESQLSEYQSVSRFARHKSFIMLRMLEQAHDACGKPRVPALTAWIGIDLLIAVELFHSKSARRQLRTGIRQLAESGVVSLLSSFVNQKAFADTEINGFRDAVEGYCRMTLEITALRDRRQQRRAASIAGYAVAKYIAHMGLIVVCFIVLKEYALR